MVTTLERRVARLEEPTGGNKCPECGFDGDLSKVEYVVHWENTDGPTKPHEFCETCGFQLTCTVYATWGDSPGLAGRR
jgi:hypothetical protein